MSKTFTFVFAKITIEGWIGGARRGVFAAATPGRRNTILPLACVSRETAEAVFEKFVMLLPFEAPIVVEGRTAVVTSEDVLAWEGTEGVDPEPVELMPGLFFRELPALPDAVWLGARPLGTLN
jgi:hypothetical protein